MNNLMAGAMSLPTNDTKAAVELVRSEDGSGYSFCNICGLINSWRA